MSLDSQRVSRCYLSYKQSPGWLANSVHLIILCIICYCQRESIVTCKIVVIPMNSQSIVLTCIKSFIIQSLYLYIWFLIFHICELSFNRDFAHCWRARLTCLINITYLLILVLAWWWILAIEWVFLLSLLVICSSVFFFSLSLSLSLSVLTSIFPDETELAGFIGAAGDGGGGDNWSYKTCKAPVRMSSPTNQQPAFYRLDALSVVQPTVSVKGNSFL